MMDQRLNLLLEAAKDLSVTTRYFDKIRRSPELECWVWVGALAGKGHGRFWITRGVVVVAHRFGWLINAGDVDELPEVVSHNCDNPVCQNPAHLNAGTFASNRREYFARRATPGSPLRDVRGAIGRARELRAAARGRRRLDDAVGAGLSELDRHQGTLW